MKKEKKKKEKSRYSKRRCVCMCVCVRARKGKELVRRKREGLICEKNRIIMTKKDRKKK